MRRYRRLVLMERVIPFLAALVGLIALAGAIVVQQSAVARTAAVSAQIAEVRGAITALTARAAALEAMGDDGTAAGLLALQDRMNRIEADWQTERAAMAATPAAAAPTETATATAEVDPNLPTTDCIPLGTRFMVVPNESYPLCQSSAVVKVGSISADSVDVEGAGPIVETGFGTLVGTRCTVMVFSADVEGFAELRVSCT